MGESIVAASTTKGNGPNQNTEAWLICRLCISSFSCAVRMARMKSNSDFWLTLNTLADDLEREGSSNQDRLKSLLEVLGHVSLSSRAVYQENAVFVLRVLNSLVEGFDGSGEWQRHEPSSPAN